MTAHWLRFNLYLAALGAVAVLLGCQSAEKKKKEQLCVFRVHLQVPRDGTDRNKVVEVNSENPIRLNIDTYPLLSENRVQHARVFESIGGFAIEVQYDHIGSRVLETTTVANRGAHFAIFCAFGEQLTNTRWLGAPIISRVITNGIITFTPNVPRDEADQIVLGLNNDVKVYGSKLDQESNF